MGTNLKDRATKANQVAKQGNQPATVAELIERQKDEIARALPKHMDADRIARIALTVVKQTPKLAQCNPASLLGALMTSSQLGLEPGPLGEAYLVPFGNNVTFIPGYRGLIKLAWQSGQLEMIDAHVVYKNDDFEFQFGLDQKLHHRPTLDPEGKGIPVAVYAVAKFKNGGSAFQVMSIEDVEVIRSRSKSAHNGPWVSDWDAMAKKTVIKQLMKFLPLSPELMNVATATALDESVRTDVTAPVDEFIPGEVVQVETSQGSESMDAVTGEIVDNQTPPPADTPPVEDPWAGE
ncbi:MAG: recombinase RecT [Candidatus Nanopelagicales bacterium]